MGVFLILAILVSGFITCHYHPYYYLKLHRFEGQYFYFMAGWVGLCTFVWAILLNVAIVNVTYLFASYTGVSFGKDYVTLTSELLKSHNFVASDKTELYAWSITIVTSMLFPLPYLRGKVYELIKSRRLNVSKDILKLAITSNLLKDSPLDFLLFEASLSPEINLMLTMKDRKVYVGKVASMGEPNENRGADQEILLVPIMSGYRDKDNLKVEFTTFYDKINHDFSIVLRQEDIVSAVHFDFDIYKQFQTKALRFKLNRKRSTNSYLLNPNL